MATLQATSVDGTLTCDSLVETSLLAGKADLRPLADARRLLAVRAKTYRAKGKPAARRDVGFVADDLEAAGLEELLGRDDDGALVGVRYSRVVAMLLELVRDQDQQLADARNRLTRLETRS